MTAARAKTTSAGPRAKVAGAAETSLPSRETAFDRSAAARPLEFSASQTRRNHNVFRYPAKFHPPIAAKLIELFSERGDTVFDPFCGSGTLLVEAATLGRHSVGVDVDPLAVFVARAKTAEYDMADIRASAEQMRDWLKRQRGEDEQRWGDFTIDIDQETFDGLKTSIAPYLPELPKLDHWFRRRVTIQLATIRGKMDSPEHTSARPFLQLCFASIIRNASNADPVPVSGLEVTSHMLAKEKAGRSVDTYGLMVRALTKSLEATKVFQDDRAAGVNAIVHEADAREYTADLVGNVDAAITSPPYLTAVDYYRRHTLEMYWLGLTERREQRLAIMPRYIGRDRVGQIHMPSQGEARGACVADRWLKRFPDIKPERARAFRHYCDGMSRALSRMGAVVKEGGPIVIVAGDVRLCGKSVSMVELMNDLSSQDMNMTDHLWYPIINRYMSYQRNNEANIAADHVLVFRRN